MSPPDRVRAAVALAAVAAAGLVVGITQLTDHGSGASASTGTTAFSKPRAGTPPLALDLGLREDAEAVALRRASRLLAAGKRAQAEAVFARYGSLQAKMGATFAAWGPGALERVQALARAHPDSAFAQLHLGIALLWAGRDSETTAPWRAAVQRDPDTASAVRASDFLHPRTPPGSPFFAPSFGTPPAIASLRPVSRQYAALEQAASRPDAHAKILWGIALQRLGRPISAERQFAAAARLAPNDPEALTAAAVGRFTKDDPARAFSRLGPLTRRFPHAATVRFHLGLLLIWIGDFEGAKRQLRLAQADGRGSQLGKEATGLLATLEKR
jgi:tetratricopeptide (TPR) repeat protein